MTDYLKRARDLFPGLMLTLVTALSASYLAAQYDAPVMLFVLLLGMAMNFLSEQESCCTGINFAARTLLRLGVALLGLRITVEQVGSIGLANLAFVTSAVAATIVFGMFAAVRLGRSRDFGLLTGGSVAICGASAAVAIATLLPGHPDREKQVVFTILCVTTLSTLAMIFYPAAATQFGFDDRTTGLFLGATIHDVAQVVGAGYSVSIAAGDFATITKLYRVVLLVPVFLLLAIVFRRREAEDLQRMPVPWFIFGFIGCVLLATFDVLPQSVVNQGLDLSRLCLIMAIAALGMKSSPRILFRGSLPALLLVVSETLLLAGLILAWILLA